MNTPDTAPKDGIWFIGRFPIGRFVTMWNEAESQWILAVPSLSFYEGKQDPCFENEYEDESELMGWWPMPG